MYVVWECVRALAFSSLESRRSAECVSLYFEHTLRSALRFSSDFACALRLLAPRFGHMLLFHNTTSFVSFDCSIYTLDGGTVGKRCACGVLRPWVWGWALN